ncbi:Type-I membrane glycoprotein, partial [Monkeypox virus]
MMMKWIISILT